SIDDARFWRRPRRHTFVHVAGAAAGREPRTELGPVGPRRHDVRAVERIASFCRRGGRAASVGARRRGAPLGVVPDLLRERAGDRSRRAAAIAGGVSGRIGAESAWLTVASRRPAPAALPPRGGVWCSGRAARPM